MAISMQNEKNAEFFNKRTKEISSCNHAYIVSNWVKTEKSQNASQYVCRKCLNLVSMESIMELHTQYLELLVHQNPET
jgi:hypothetical protein